MGDHTGEVTGEEMTFVRTPMAEKVSKALALKMAGADLEEICLVVGFASQKEAMNAIEKAVAANLKSDPKARAQLRELANRRLERLLRAVWGKAVDEENPDQALFVTKAREIIDRHIKLYGLDAPAEMVVHTPEAAEIERWVMGFVGKEHEDIVEADVLDEEDDEDGTGGIAALASA